MFFKWHVSVHVQAQILNMGAGTDVGAIELYYHIVKYARTQLSTAEENALSFSRIYHQAIKKKISLNFL